MESIGNEPIPAKSNSTNSNTVPIRIHKSTARLLRSLLLSVNKKKLGKRVKADQIISKALALLTDDHLEEVKTTTYSSADHLEVEFQKYCAKNGAISKDEFLNKLLANKNF